MQRRGLASLLFISLGEVGPVKKLVQQAQKLQFARVRKLSSLCAVALLVLLAGAAGAGIVTADFISGAHDLLDRSIYAASGHAGLFEFAFLLSLECFFKFVNRGSDRPRAPSFAAVTIHQHSALSTFPTRSLRLASSALARSGLGKRRYALVKSPWASARLSAPSADASSRRITSSRSPPW